MPAERHLTTTHRILRPSTRSWMRFRVFLTRLAGLWQTRNWNGETFSLLYRYGQGGFSGFPCYSDAPV